MEDKNKAYIKVHKSLTRIEDDKFIEGKKYNVMFIPKGVKVGNIDFSQGVLNPLVMIEDKFNPNMMLAIYDKERLKDNAVSVHVLKDGKYEKVRVDIDVLSEKVHEANMKYLKERTQNVEAEEEFEM